MTSAHQGPTDQDITAALDALALGLTRLALSAGDKPALEAAAVGVFLLRYRRERGADGAATLRAAVEALGAADRIALAEETEVAVHTVDRWATGATTLAPAIAARVERWCAERAGARAGRLTSNDPCPCGGRGYHASQDEDDPVYVYCSCPAGIARERADEQERAALADDTGPRLHIPRGLLVGAGG